MTRKIALSILLLARLVPAQDRARMDEIVKSYVDQKQFMGSILVGRGNELVFEKSYGSANVEWDIPNAADSRFRIGSITKQFTAASILLLQERGKLSLDDPIRKHLPDAPPAWDKITVHHVLSHTSGIPSFTGFPDYQATKTIPSTPEKLLARFRDKPLDFQPGEKWSYSNSGYVLLGYLIEKVTGETYQKFVQENIFIPLGLKESGYDSHAAIIHRRAAGYSLRNKVLVNADYIDMTIPHGAGALYSTTRDLWKWNQALFGGKLLSEASLTKMMSPIKNDYGYGLVIQTGGKRKMVGHGGGIEGFNTFLGYYPEDKLTVVALSNLNGPATQPIAMSLAAIARGDKVMLSSERKEITVAPGILESYTGTYQLRPGFDLVITLESGQLNSQATNQPKVPIFAESETKFFLKVVEAQIEFIKDAQGAVNQLILYQGGQEIKAARIAK